MNEGEFIALLKDMLEKAGQVEAKLEQLGESVWAEQPSGAKPCANDIKGASDMVWRLAAKATAMARDATHLCARLDNLGARGSAKPAEHRPN
jgi:hypothetical protein